MSKTFFIKFENKIFEKYKKNVDKFFEREHKGVSEERVIVL